LTVSNYSISSPSTHAPCAILAFATGSMGAHDPGTKHKSTCVQDCDITHRNIHCYILCDKAVELKIIDSQSWINRYDHVTAIDFISISKQCFIVTCFSYISPQSVFLTRQQAIHCLAFEKSMCATAMNHGRCEAARTAVARPHSLSSDVRFQVFEKHLILHLIFVSTLGTDSLQVILCFINQEICSIS